MSTFCHTWPQLTNSTDLFSASADQLGPLVALKSLTRPSDHPTVRCETLNLTLRPDEVLHTTYKHSIFTLDTPILTLTLIVHYQAIQLNYSALVKELI